MLFRSARGAELLTKLGERLLLQHRQLLAVRQQQRAAQLCAERGAGRGGVYEDLTGMVGNTPVVKISDKLCPAGVEVYAKCEYFNPLSSVKDRLAVAIIEEAEASGALKPGMTVVEATSGNTGIAVAMVCAQRGYDCVICMAEPFSVERRRLMRMLGAKVIVTPKAGKGTGMVRKAEELCAKHGWFLCHQFENEANWKFHEATTGPEIVNDFKAAGNTMTSRMEWRARISSRCGAIARTRPHTAKQAEALLWAAWTRMQAPQPSPTRNPASISGPPGGYSESGRSRGGAQRGQEISF